MAKIDIVTPTYRRHEVLAEFLAMLEAQTYRDFRLLLVNDDPGNSLRAFLSAHKTNFEVVLLEPGLNQKAAAARNLALRYAEAPYIALCDDDDLWRPWHLEQLLDLLENSDTDLAYAAVDLVTTKRTPTGRHFGERRRFAFLPDIDFLRRWNTMPISGQLYKRSLHETLGEFDEKLPHYADWDWNLRVCEADFHVKLSLPVSVDIVFDVDGDNQSGDPGNMASELERLIEKHRLGVLPSSNYWLMLDFPEVAERIVAA